MTNRTGNSAGEPRLLWVIFVDRCLAFALILCVLSCLGSCLEWCLKTLKFFLFIRKFYTCTWVALAYRHVQRPAYVGFSLGQPRIVCGLPLYTVTYKPEH